MAALSDGRVIRVDSRVPFDVRLASIFGQAPRHSQAVINPLEGVRLRTLARSGPPADHAGRKEARQIPFRLSQATTKPRIPVSLKLFAKPIISSRGGNRLVAVTERSTIASETVALTFDTSQTAVTALRAV